MCGGCCQSTGPKISSLPRQWCSDAKEITLVLKDRMPLRLPGEELIVIRRRANALLVSTVTPLFVFLRQSMGLQWRNLDWCF